MVNGYKIAFQLYTSRNFPPLEAQLEGLAELGYDGVEPFLPNYGDDPARFRRRSMPRDSPATASIFPTTG